MKKIFFIAMLFINTGALSEEAPTKAVEKKEVKKTEAEILKALKKELKHHEDKVAEIKRQIEAIELKGKPSPAVLAIEAEIKLLEGQIKTIRAEREAKKKKVHQPYNDAVAAVSKFEKIMKNAKKALKKVYKDKVSDYQAENKQKASAAIKRDLELKWFTKPYRRYEAKLVELKNKVDKDGVKDLWKDAMKPYTKRINEAKNKVSVLLQKKRELKRGKK